jgi:hypothetical protein
MKMIKDKDGYFIYAERDLPRGMAGAVIPLTGGRARIVYGPKDENWYNDEW